MRRENCGPKVAHHAESSRTTPPRIDPQAGLRRRADSKRIDSIATRRGRSRLPENDSRNRLGVVFIREVCPRGAQRDTTLAPNEGLSESCPREYFLGCNRPMGEKAERLRQRLKSSNYILTLSQKTDAEHLPPILFRNCHHGETGVSRLVNSLHRFLLYVPQPRPQPRRIETQ
jgi:hypothetical protein